MGAYQFHRLLFLFLLRASSLTWAQHLYCHKGIYVDIEEDPGSTFNWTTEKVETCGNGELCQESVLLIKAGAKTAVLASKGCIPETNEAMTFVQHTAPPGLIVVSYSNYCEDPLCNTKEGISDFWKSQQISDDGVSATLHCPTCVALGTCFSAPSLPCPNGTTRCYRGKIDLNGGGIDSSVEVRGCTSTTGCKLMARIATVGPMMVKEVCPHQSLSQPRKTESGATWLHVSVWCLGSLLPLLLQTLCHFS